MKLVKSMILALVASGFVVAGASDARADLLGYYQFDDGTADDASGKGNDATLQGGAVINAAGGVSGLAGDGTLNLGAAGNSANAAITNAATGAFDSLTANNAGTISLWVFGSGQPVNDTAFGLYDAGNNRQFQAHVPWGDGTIYFDVGGGATTGTHRISKAEGNAANYEGQWNHYIFVKDGGQSRIYQNGSLWHSGATTAAIGSITQAFIGSEHSLTHSYGGQIDEFSVFDRALTGQEIQRLTSGAEADTIEGFRNVALLGTATQSSTRAAGGAASRAIDNNINGAFGGNSVTHTDQASGDVWWQVTLPGDVMIADARLWNRTDCCGDRLSNYSVTVFNEANAIVFTQDYHVGAGQTGVSEFIDIPDTVVGNRVRVELIGGMNNATNGPTVLSLAEVQAFGMVRNGDNFAKFGTATQSSTHGSGAVASRAIDNNRDGVFTNNSVTHTNNELEPWWRVDLGIERYIDGVQIFERTDCCDDRLANFDVRVLNAAGSLVWEGTIADVPNDGHRIGIGTGPGSFGRFVEIQMNSTGVGRSLELAEVEVYAGKVRNIAREGFASQSSTAGSRTADHAIDGNVVGWEAAFGVNPYAHTSDEPNSWWQVALADRSNIENIILYNRGDCCGTRLGNFRVSIELDGIEVWGENFFEGAGSVGELLRIDLDDKVMGDLVRIRLLGLNNDGNGVLQLSEVQVWGTTVPTPAALPAGLMLLTAVALRRKRR